LNIGLSGKYATWAGTLLDPKRPIVLVAELMRETEAALRLGRVGFDRVVGYLRGGPAAFAGRPELLRRVERVDAVTMHDQLNRGESEVVLDVRTPSEWSDSRIEGSLNVPLAELERRIGEIPRDKRLALHCQSGYRSSVASGLLERHGFSGFTDLAGGIASWRSAGLPLAGAHAAQR
jgi:rhodanese-related sulfurtransferase